MPANFTVAEFFNGIGTFRTSADMAAHVSFGLGLVGVAVHLGLPQADIATLVLRVPRTASMRAREA